MTFLASDAAGDVTGRVFEVSGNVVGVFAPPAIESWAVKDPDDGPWTQAELEGVVPSLLAGGRGRGAAAAPSAVPGPR